MEIQKTRFWFKSVLWYLKHPKLYRQFFRRIVAKFGHSLDTREESDHWCKEHAIDSLEAIATITGTTKSENVRERFKDVFAVADQAIQTCPMKMGGAGDLNLLYWLCEYLEAKNVAAIPAGRKTA